MLSSTNDLNQYQSAPSHTHDTPHSTSTSNDMSSSSCSSCTSTFFHGDTLQLVIELLDNCNTMIAMNNNSLKDIEERDVDSTTDINKKIDILLNHIKDLEDRLEDIGVQNKASTKQIMTKLETQVKDAASTTTKESEIIDKRLRSLSSRVSSIGHVFIIRSNYNKRRRVSQEEGGGEEACVKQEVSRMCLSSMFML